MNFKTSALIAALALTATASFAASDENNLLDDYLEAKAHAQALSSELETIGVKSNPKVEFDGPATLSQKLDAYQAKIADLQGQFDISHQAN